jgi:ABC-2 type transport system ATP-binding protein
VIVINHGTLILDAPIATLKREFLQTKVIELRLQEGEGAWAALPFQGVTLVERGEWGLKLEVDTTRQPIDAVIGHLVAHYHVADVTISDPPLEEIIALIYQRRPPDGASVAAPAPANVPVEAAT